MKRGISIAPLLVILALALASGGIEAQDDPALQATRVETGLIKRKSIVIVRERHEKPDAAGVEVGNFLLLPDLLLTTYYDDNVFATERSTESDLVFVATPSIKVKPASGSDSFLLDAGVESSRFREWSSENMTDSWIALKGQRKIGSGQRLDGGISYRRDHEDRGSPDAEAGENPTRFDERAAAAAYAMNLADHHIKLAADISYLDFDDVDSPLGSIDYDDRDRTERSLVLRYLYRYTAGGAVFIEGETDDRDYEQSQDNEGNERSSEGSRVGLGLEFARADLFGRLMIGNLQRDYESAEFEDADETDVAALLNWRIFGDARLILRTQRSIEETTLDGSPGYLLQNNSLRASFDLTEKGSLYLDLIDSSADYYEIDRVDDYLNLGIGYSYQMLDRLGFSTEFHRAERDSSVDGEDYDINQVFLRVRAAI